MPNIIDLTGKTFGRLKVMARAENGKDNSSRWLCLCACGKEKTIRSKSLRTGSTVSCGCFRSEKMRKEKTKHGECDSKLYAIWKAIKQRCLNPKNQDYCYYGARGVTICPNWTDDFSQFKNDVGDRTDEGLTIDRIDNDGDYEPGNIKWSTWSEQARNKRPKGSVFTTRRGR